MIFDITRKERAIDTLVNYLKIDQKVLMNYLEEHSFDFDIMTFLYDFHINPNTLDLEDHSLVGLHVTNSNNECKEFLEKGIMDVKHVLEGQNDISEFLKQQDILFNKDYTYFTYQDTIYDIKNTGLYEKIVNESAVHCFLCVEDSGYFSEQLSIRPEVITMISEIIGDSNIKDFWDLNHDTYMIKFEEKLINFDLESVSQSESVLNTILALINDAVDMIQLDGHVEILAKLKKGYTIQPDCIIYSHQYYNN